MSINKIQKSKYGLIGLGIILSIIAAACVVLAVICTTAGGVDNRWWLWIIAAVLYVLALAGIILGIVFVWTGSVLKATKGSLKEDNLAIGTANMEKCPNCGSEVKAEDTHCGNCGANLSKTKICPKCNAEIDFDKKHCTKCGADLSNQSEQISKPTQKTKTDNVDTKITDNDNPTE